MYVTLIRLRKFLMDFWTLLRYLMRVIMNSWTLLRCFRDRTKNLSANYFVPDATLTIVRVSFEVSFLFSRDRNLYVLRRDHFVRSLGTGHPRLGPEALLVVKESAPTARSRSGLRPDTLFYDLAWILIALFLSRKRPAATKRKKNKLSERD